MNTEQLHSITRYAIQNAVRLQFDYNDAINKDWSEVLYNILDALGIKDARTEDTRGGPTFAKAGWDYDYATKQLQDGIFNWLINNDEIIFSFRYTPELIRI